MRANPGGILAPEDVVGRDKLIERLWRALEFQSVVLTSERRVGKTSVIRKMVNAPGPERVCFMRDVEGFRSPGEFIEGIYVDVQPILSKKERARMAMWGLLEKLGGTEISHLKLPHVKPHWKNILTALFEDIFTEETRPIIFFWDELPLFPTTSRPTPESKMLWSYWTLSGRYGRNMKICGWCSQGRLAYIR